MPTDNEKLKFSEIIENFATETKSSYIDSITEYCEKNGMEEIVAATLLTNPLKSKLMDEASKMNLLKKKISKLPL
jgi:hypothetical protein